jgi:acyl-CoA synthetase (AMP-forming)/AMP-acid ligase II
MQMRASPFCDTTTRTVVNMPNSTESINMLTSILDNKPPESPLHRAVVSPPGLSRTPRPRHVCTSGSDQRGCCNFLVYGGTPAIEGVSRVIVKSAKRLVFYQVAFACSHRGRVACPVKTRSRPVRHNAGVVAQVMKHAGDFFLQQEIIKCRGAVSR